MKLGGDEMKAIEPFITLAACRVNANQTQNEWAKSLNVSPATVKNWEKYKHKVPIDKAILISKMSNIPLDYIILYSISSPI